MGSYSLCESGIVHRILVLLGTTSGIFGTGPHSYRLHPGWIGFPIRFVPSGSDMDANYFR